ncbi:MAG: hypothetical protein IT204_15925 [Fimbriimonadaceae bacterium]|nr:hypothetical protein [Fimbriimonadaceae bacterium]
MGACLLAAGADHPVTLGVNCAGSALLTRQQIHYWDHEPFYAALAALGVQQVDLQIWPVTNAGADNSRLTAASLARIDAALRAHGLRYTLNLEVPNFAASMEVDPGVNEFARPGGLHRWDLRMDWLQALLPAVRGRSPGFVGLTYDECEHMLLSGNKFSDYPQASFDQPLLANTHGLPLLAAYDRLLVAATALRAEHYQNRVPLHTEQVWPDLFHLFAAAGWNITPKLLKEHLSPVVISIALGAALQYADRGISLGASPDLWRYDLYPGHSPQALRSALLLGYWLGCDTVYVENLDYDGPEGRQPLAGPAGSLLHWSSATEYQVTPHGQVYREFARDYLPAHPRRIDWRDYQPKLAIIRLPDGGWGQFSAGPQHGEAASRNRLLGNRDHPLDDPAREWLQVWSVLTHGVARPGALSLNNPFVYPREQWPDFFVPVDSVAVFDHTVRGPVLDGVEAFVVCGHALSAATFAELTSRVTAGASCLIARRLYQQHTTSPPGPRWRLVDDFADPAVAAWLQPFLGPPEVARYRFRNQLVEFRRGAVADAVEVRVTDR